MNPKMRYYEPLVGIEGVSSGGSASIKVPKNRRHIMQRVFASATIGGVPTTDPTLIIDKVIHMVGTRTIREEFADWIAKIRAFQGLPTDPSGALLLSYAEPHRADVIDEMLTAWDMYGVDGDFILKFILKTGLVNPSLKIVDVYDNAQFTDGNGNALRQVIKRSFSTFNLGTVGDITSLPVDLPILGVYLLGAAPNTIDHVKVTVDDTNVIHDMDAAENAAFLSDYGLAATAFPNGYALRFDVEGQIARRLEGIRSMAIRVTQSAAQSVTAVIEQVAPYYI